ncbi:Gfo/Idh/MocA family protein, partial [Phytoactinopolyspora endophytica]|uniref:Gfo/Idh/MocA family protein n=1 Tax=Phytoactinopolyspora endophytica TaxID=1642495 RepID=UPI0013ECE5CF
MMTPGPSGAASSSPGPIKVGLVGAGPWASILHAPLWSAGPQTALTGVWARRIEAARSVADMHGTEAVESFDELLERSDAIAFSVPPDVQWRMAVRAADAGRHLILEKPIADTLGHARTLTDAVATAGVGSLVMFTTRFSSGVRAFLEQARSFDT